MSITETLKKTLDELQIEQRLAGLGQDFDRVYASTLESVTGYVATREDDIASLVDKVATTIDTRTEGRFADEIGKVTRTLHRSVSTLAERGAAREA